jgi:hypothetical protein
MQVIILLSLLTITHWVKYISLLWFVIEFILLVVRGAGFDWRSVILTIFCYMFDFALALIYTLYFKQKTIKKNNTGKFQERLEAMKKQRNKK